jgi:MFS family permease
VLTRTMSRPFYGWRIVAVCLIAGMFANAFGLFGAGVYLHELVSIRGWPTGLVSGAITTFYVTSALLLIPVGSLIGRHGGRLSTVIGALAMGAGIAAIGRVEAPWQAYVAFFVMSFGWACLSLTAVATTLAPWFERHQGRAVSIASLGASVGGMTGVPVLLFSIGIMGFAATTTVAAAVMLVVILPLGWFVMRRRPQDLGLLPDGVAVAAPSTAARPAGWTRRAALGTWALQSVMLAFGLAMLVQVGFITHQVTLLSSALGAAGVSLAASGAALAALLGRLLLVRFADQISPRATACAVMGLASLSLLIQGLLPTPSVLFVGSLVMGLTIGNVTTLSPIIVRREFGAATFGAVFGVASCGIQLAAAMGPSVYGLLYDAFGGYRMPLLLAAALDVVAAFIVVSGAAPKAARL